MIIGMALKPLMYTRNIRSNIVLRPMSRPRTVPTTIVIANPSATAVMLEPSACRKAGSVITFGIASTTVLGFAT